MKKFFIVFLLIIINSISSFAIDEVVLEPERKGLDHLADIYYGNVEETANLSPVLKLFTKDGLVFDDAYINSVKISFLYGSNLSFSKIHDKSFHSVYSFPVFDTILNVKFNENKSEFMFDYNFLRDLDGYSHRMGHRISQLYLSHHITENQTILIGQGSRLPVIVNGSLSTMGQEMVLKSQIGRTLGEAMSVGVRNIAKYKYLDYDIGLYDSTRFMKEFGQGIDFNGHVMIKPLADIEEKSGSLKLGVGYDIGDYYNSYHLYSVYAGYDYKNFHLKGEYANADGYNSIAYSKNNAEGFYTTLAYDINPKLQIIGRFDYFTPNKLHAANNTQEYTCGLTYKPYKNIKLLLNYVRKNISNSADSNMILFATRFII